ncbi:hypothetical protein M433DRAFT_431108 [Acidomyces richmondensis BFW]|nr:MAG: hypothetical protein FE78DRAFT_442236 [Acidomyces sp. 'richmondensis']KYG42147.1 hypothetical protein M433DRAFT_431108 [Acidomyces richmondensis BFW]
MWTTGVRDGGRKRTAVLTETVHFCPAILDFLTSAVFLIRNQYTRGWGRGDRHIPRIRDGETNPSKSSPGTSLNIGNSCKMLNPPFCRGNYVWFNLR